MGKVNNAIAAGHTKKRATRLKTIEDRLDALGTAQIHQAKSLENFGGAYNNLLAKLVRKGVLTEDDLRRSLDEPDDAEPESTEPEPKAELGWWTRLWRSLFGAPKEDSRG